MSATMSSPHVDVTVSSPHVDVKTTMTSPKSDEDIETSLASTKTSTSSKNNVFEYVAFSLSVLTHVADSQQSFCGHPHPFCEPIFHC